MKWPWQRRKAAPMPTTAPPAPPSPDLERAREAAANAERTLAQARARRPRVVATGKALEQSMNRNHLAELVRNALGSGS